MNFLSVCSGIEAASQATVSLGWSPVAFAEIEPFPCAVLAHRHPNVPNLGDMTRYLTWPEELLAETDILKGGTPCQAFSIAGERQSLADERGNLTLTLCHLYDHLDHTRHLHGRPPTLLFWENVPGVLNTPDNAFGCFLAGLAGEDRPLSPPGGAWLDAGYVRGPKRALAWRVLDAQYFGLAQRRRRVFLVAGPRDGFHPEQVLFEFDSLRRHSPPRREPGQGPAPTLSARTQGGGGLGTDFDLDGGLDESTIEVARALLGKENSSHAADQDTYIPEISYAIAAGGGGSKFGSGRHNQDTFIPEVCGTLPSGGKAAGSATTQDAESGLLIPETAHTLRSEGFDASEDGTGRGTPLIPELIAFPERLSGTQCASTANLSPSLQARNPTAIAFQERGRKGGGPNIGRQEMNIVQPLPFDTTQITSKANHSHPKEGDPCHPLASGAHPPAIAMLERSVGTPARLDSEAPGDLYKCGVCSHTWETHSHTTTCPRCGSAEAENVMIQPRIGPHAGQTFNLDTQAWDDPKPFATDLYNGSIHGDLASTLGARGSHSSASGPTVAEPIAFSLRGREGGAMPEADPDNLAVQRAASGGSSRSYVALRAQGQDGFTPDSHLTPPLLSSDSPNAAAPCILQVTTTANGSEATLQPPPTTANSPAYRVRRLTPTECERLQGFPDGYTRIPWRKAPAEDCPDGPRYKALGNSWAVPVITWICARIPLGFLPPNP